MQSSKSSKVSKKAKTASRRHAASFIRNTTDDINIEKIAVHLEGLGVNVNKLNSERNISAIIRHALEYTAKNECDKSSK